MSGVRSRAALLAGVSWLLSAPAAAPATGIDISYANGLLGIRCTRVSLGEVLKQVSSATGMQVVLDDVARETVLTADIDPQPVNVALERILEGQGVSYAMSLSPDGHGVSRIYVVREGGGSKTRASEQHRSGTIAAESGPPVHPLFLPLTQPPANVSSADEDDEVAAQPGDDSAPVPAISAETIEGILKSGIALPANTPAGNRPGNAGTFPFPLLNGAGPSPIPSPAQPAEKSGSAVNH